MVLCSVFSDSLSFYSKQCHFGKKKKDPDIRLILTLPLEIQLHSKTKCAQHYILSGYGVRLQPTD